MNHQDQSDRGYNESPHYANYRRNYPPRPASPPYNEPNRAVVPKFTVSFNLMFNDPNVAMELVELLEQARSNRQVSTAIAALEDRLRYMLYGNPEDSRDQPTRG